MSKTLYLRCQTGEISDRVLLTGDPARVERIGQMLDAPQWIARNREFHTLTGHYRDQRITALSSGIGAPSAAIAIEELKTLGVRAVIRVGTTMGLQAPLGALVIATGAVRLEGTSAAYLPLPYPAIPDWTLSHVVEQVCRQRGLDFYLGLTATCDSFYTQMAPELVGRRLPDFDIFKQAGVLALDMETSLLYILGQTLKLTVTSVCAVTVQAEPFQALETDQRTRLEETLIHVALESLSAWRG